MEVIQQKLHVMDMTAISLAMEQSLPLHVVNLHKSGNIMKTVLGEDIGTLVYNE